MRIALQHTTDIGVRAGRILLAEPELQVLGLLDRRVEEPDPRIRSTETIDGYDAVMTDSTEYRPIVDRAANAGIHCVVWVDGNDPAALEDLEDLEGFEATTLLMGSNLAGGLAPSLADHEAATLPGGTTDLIAWTEPGKPLRSGEAIAFPDPVGARWGHVRSDDGTTRRVAVPVDGEWAATLARVSDDATTRIVGVSDHAQHLEAISFAAGARAVVGGAYDPGIARPSECAADYLFAALGVGLDVASFSADTPRT
jgi:hypothetical protein